MPISRHVGRFAFGVAVAGLLGSVSLQPSPALSDQGEEFFLQFHSFVPAQESLKLPKLSDKAVWRDDMAIARQAWRAGKFVRARKHLKRALKKGHVTAAWYLGHLYQQGRGVKKNEEAAFHYYRRVALSYEPDAPINRTTMIAVDSLVRVANVYRTGSTQAKVERDPQRAIRIYNLATSHGHPGADFGLGVVYLKGIGVKKNPRRGLRWLSKAASKRYAPAEALLGDLYWEGMYVRKDPARALMWYLLARQTANPTVHRQVYNRLDEMLLAVSEEDRERAVGWAGRRNKKNPAKVGILPVSD